MAKEKQDGHASEAAKTWRISFTSEEFGELGLALATRIHDLEERAKYFSMKPENASDRDLALKWAQECETIMKKINEAWSGLPE